MNKRIKIHGKRMTAMMLALALAISLFTTTAFAAQQNSYHDPAEHWMSSSNRTNELDVNAVVTHETFYCVICKQYTSFTLWRTPEYTKDGLTALSRNVKYSDGTMVGGTGTGSILDGTPGVNAYYTGYHWTKAMCDTCGTMNSNGGLSDYDLNKNVYVLHDCAAEFTENLSETVTYEYTDSSYHTKTVSGGSYCGFCYGTHYTTSTVLERHDLKTSVLSQPANGRFAIVESCADCDYTSFEYVTAKSVVANYYGTVDGKSHTVTVSDLSESGVTTQIRYGTSANSCNLTTAPSFTEEGQYAVYYAITYAYKNTSFTENGVAYVQLSEDSTQNNENTGNCGNSHNFILLDTVPATCKSLGYDRYLCIDCGKIEKQDYTAALDHEYKSLILRDATCETDGEMLEICTRCGDVKTTTIPKGEHKYSSHTVDATCTSPGYTVKECSVCGDRHITNITPALKHNYETVVTEPTCETGGHTTHICYGCGSSFVTDYTDALGHKESDWIIDREPTADSEGSKHKECEICGEITESEKIQMTTAQKEKHSAYIVGYTDGTFGAERSMLRSEAAAIFARLLAEKNGDVVVPVLSTKYSDIPANAWYSGYVKYLTSFGIIYGRENDTFAPNEAITRGEFTAMAVRFFAAYGDGDGEIMEKYAEFTDVADGYWAAEYIRDAAIHGWVFGYGDGTFGAEKLITRAEVVTLVNRLLGWTADKSFVDANLNRLNTFSDMTDKNHWAYYAVMEAANSHTALIGDTETWSK